MFGDYVKNQRLKLKKTLCGFCKEVGYAKGNWSKIEQGTLYPPKGCDALNRIFIELGLPDEKKEGFFDLAAVSRGELPLPIALEAAKQKTLLGELLAVFKGLRKKYGIPLCMGIAKKPAYDAAVEAYKKSMSKEELERKRTTHRNAYLEECSEDGPSEAEIEEDFNRNLARSLKLHSKLNA